MGNEVGSVDAGKEACGRKAGCEANEDVDHEVAVCACVHGKEVSVKGWKPIAGDEEEVVGGEVRSVGEVVVEWIEGSEV